MFERQRKPEGGRVAVDILKTGVGEGKGGKLSLCYWVL